MFKASITASAFAATLLLPHAVAAQSAPAVRVSLGIEGGAEAVQNVGGLFGAQLSISLSNRVDVFGEGLYLQNVVTRRRVESTAKVSDYLSTTQGKPASGTLEIPAGLVSGGARIFLKDFSSLRLYATGQAGIAKVTLRPAFILGGADVTTVLPQYGVTLGADLTGSATCVAVGGGVGIMANHGPWYFDAALRVLSIQLETQAASAKTASVGFGYRF